MQRCELHIINKLGLHARAAAKFVSTASAFPCSVRVGRTDEQLSDGKNIMSVMMLAASKGTSLILITDGDQEEQAQAAIIDLVNRYFDEEQ